jgi:hypothetical protein
VLALGPGSPPLRGCGRDDSVLARQIGAAGIADENALAVPLERDQPIQHARGEVAVVEEITDEDDVRVRRCADGIGVAGFDGDLVQSGIELRGVRGEGVDVDGDRG